MLNDFQSSHSRSLSLCRWIPSFTLQTIINDVVNTYLINNYQCVNMKSDNYISKCCYPVDAHYEINAAMATGRKCINRIDARRENIRKQLKCASIWFNVVKIIKYWLNESTKWITRLSPMVLYNIDNKKTGHSVEWFNLMLRYNLWLAYKSIDWRSSVVYTVHRTQTLGEIANRHNFIFILSFQTQFLMHVRML